MEAANHPNCNRQPVGEEIFIFDPLAYPQNVGAQENHDKDSLMSRQGGLSSHGIQPCLCILGGSEGRRDIFQERWFLMSQIPREAPHPHRPSIGLAVS